MIAVRVSAVVPRSNARLPVAISYNIEPNENWSDRKSVGRPAACSGDMYPTVPITIPGRVGSPAAVWRLDTSSDSGVTSLANPKSRIFANPCLETITLAGFKSRCTIPAACAAASPSATCVASSSSLRVGTGPDATRSFSVTPSISSIAMYTVESDVPMS